jgi:hypothetical protein
VGRLQLARLLGDELVGAQLARQAVDRSAARALLDALAGEDKLDGRAR